MIDEFRKKLSAVGYNLAIEEKEDRVEFTASSEGKMNFAIGYLKDDGDHEKKCLEKILEAATKEGR